MGFMTLCQSLRLISMITSEKGHCIILIEKKSLSELVLIPGSKAKRMYSSFSILRIFQFYGFFPDDKLIRKIEKLLYNILINIIQSKAFIKLLSLVTDSFVYFSKSLLVCAFCASNANCAHFSQLPIPPSNTFVQQLFYYSVKIK